MKRTIVWFRKDFRLHDHPALWEASRRGAIIPLFIWSEQDQAEYADNEGASWWLYHSLKVLRATLRTHELHLIIKAGNEFEAIIDVIKESKADAFYFNDRYEPVEMQRQERITKQLESIGVTVNRFTGNLLFSPDLLNGKGEPYKVFTSYWNRVLQENVVHPHPVPVEMDGFVDGISSLDPDELGLPKRLLSMEKHWRPGEEAAIETWRTFSEDALLHYKKERDMISSGTTSKLSPYLAIGNISVKALWHAARRMNDEDANPILHQSIEAFLRQLAWREFAYHQLIHHPDIIRLPLRKQFLAFPWQRTDEEFRKWQEGQTGYPLIDAGMRELRETGIIHNRVRMVAASFLVKHLLIPWQDGYEWFEKNLIDYDMANNATGWQWVAGCGIDSAPYFRIFNPYLQSEKFDPDGDYIRKWVPELATLPSAYIHKPSAAPRDLLEKEGVEIGLTYPAPLVDHAAARKRALAAFEQIKGRVEEPPA